MGMGQPDRPALASHLVDDVLGWHFCGVHILAEIQADEVVLLSAEGVFGMEFGALDQDKVFRDLYRFYTGDFVVVGEAEKVVALADIAVEPFLGSCSAVRVGSVGMQIALEPEVAILVGESEWTGQFVCIL